MRIASLFCGGGGSSQGYKQEGGDVVAAFDFEEIALATYKANHSAKAYCMDVAADKGKIIEILTSAKIDLLDASPPCQGFSTANTKRNAKDERNTLPFDTLDIIEAVNPNHVIIENVTGMLKFPMRNIAIKINARLKNLGYSVSVGIVDGRDLGMPQKRARTYFVASKTMQPKLTRLPKIKPQTIKDALKGVNPSEHKPLGKEQSLFFDSWRPGEDLGDARERAGKSRAFFNYVKLDQHSQCPTIVKGNKFVHWSERRKMSLQELKVLMTFPHDYKLIGTYQQQCDRLGNAVAPTMAQHILRLFNAT